MQLLAGLLSSYCNSLLVLLLLLQHLLGRGQAGWGVFSAGCGAESAAVNRSSPPLLCGPGSVGHQDVLFPSPQSMGKVGIFRGDLRIERLSLRRVMIDFADFCGKTATKFGKHKRRYGTDKGVRWAGCHVPGSCKPEQAWPHLAWTGVPLAGGPEVMSQPSSPRARCFVALGYPLAQILDWRPVDDWPAPAAG